METRIPEHGGPPERRPPDDDMHQTLEGLDRRLERIERALGGLDMVTHNAPALVGTVTDMADEWVAHAARQGIDVDARLRRLGDLAVRLSDPQVLEVVEMLADRAELAQKAILAADHGPGFVAMVVDTFDELVARAAAEGVSVETVVGRTVEAGRSFAMFVQSDQFSALMESGVLDPRAIEIIGRAGKALADVSELEPAKTGLFGAWRAASDGDVKRTINFVTRVAKRFGQLLRLQLVSDQSRSSS